LVKRAVRRGAAFVCLPEAFNFLGTSSSRSLEIAQSLSGSYVKRYRELARESKCWLSLGGFQESVEEDSSKLRNTHIIVSSEGHISTAYRKVHLFDVDIPGTKLKESAFTKAGTSLNVCASPFGMLGLSICYDIRFPELYGALRKAGAELLLVPAAFTKTTGMAHWETLLRCRAIENQCYVLAAAQTGRHNVKRESYGDAMIVDPWGTVIARCGNSSEEGLALAEVDLDSLRKLRRRMPVSMHRKPAVYTKAVERDDGMGDPKASTTKRE